MGKPAGGNAPASWPEYIGPVRRTQGSETSQYLKERKSKETPPVAASEGGLAQTPPVFGRGVAGSFKTYETCRRRKLESFAIEGESPVSEAGGIQDDT